MCPAPYNKGMMAYLDYAATAPLLPEVLEAMLPAMREFGNPDSLHGYGRRAAALVLRARDKIASLLGVEAGEVYFTSGGTEADNQAVRCMGEGGLIVSPIEHAAVRAAAPLRGGMWSFSRVTEGGIVTPDCLGDLAGVGLVAVMAVNNETGCIQPIEELSARVHEKGALLFSDCVQAATQDLKYILKYADAISLSAHKLGGPKGVGALIVKKGVRLRPLIAGGAQERGLRGGTTNVAGVVGFAEALSLAVARREEFCAHTRRLRDRFEALIFAKMQHGVEKDGENRAPNISHLTFEKGEGLLDLLDLNGVAASGGAACSAHTAQPSHVLLAMGRSEEAAMRGIRFSFGLSTTEAETDFAAQTLLTCIQKL